ncbi:hypothetical protein VOLCADRAFT_109766 [Volvox carteri f. nagariensis]|uniref:PsbP C-terminal domain-containing protein n=1 Tax=Volvox carteri f. nagariensis TaxID=3068 RepID=D8TV81_VOLCA|nr:uncharacterized protein VOLCADRAFT_109766 [Volvox carteri f. nagariensis]EFJ48657.1 hypothetical protein VOLCADRAFT_109766 [Volvox carteri f. nagariensis]|eukprot:XP_002950456.1 hypothetical protein VOLCADRAFT_109766 [Volvox carteri f. nagariensis]
MMKNVAMDAKLRGAQPFRSSAAASVVPRCRVAAKAISTSSQKQHHDEALTAQLARRELLLSVAGLGLATCMPSSPVHAGEEFTTFLGYATPPTSYGGYGGNAKETPRYTFEYPTGWKEEVPNKVEKGTQGIDGRVVNPRMRDQRAFVITLARAGEDNKSFRLTDLDSTLSGFAGADYDLQDALSSATNRTTSSREVDDKTFYDYDIESPEYHYLVTITVSQGKVFGVFVRSPTKSFTANESKLRHIVGTFRLL